MPWKKLVTEPTILEKENYYQPVTLKTDHMSDVMALFSDDTKMSALEEIKIRGGKTMRRFDKSDLEVLETELHSIEDSFKDHKLALITYYDLFNLDNDHQTLDDDTLDFHQYISKAGLSPLKSEEISEYNDYHLGRKILKSIKDQGSCSFTAEL